MGAHSFGQQVNELRLLIGRHVTLSSMGMNLGGVSANSHIVSLGILLSCLQRRPNHAE